MITLNEVSKRYGEQAVLRGVSAVFTQGETVCIMGVSGAGKTTLCRLIMGLESPDSGQVLGAENMRFACAFQEDRLCPQLTAPANVRFACGQIDNARLQAAFAAVGLTAEDCEKPVQELSGGQSRRVALVRAMLANADAVLLDEPFKGLDAAARAQAAQFIKAQQNNRLLLCVTHDAEDATALSARIFTLI